MSSLVERLRTRTDRKPKYSIDDSDDDDDDNDDDIVRRKQRSENENLERIVRDDAKDDSCQKCNDESGKLLSCETCTYSFHPKCLVPHVKAPFPTNWRCPECVSPLNDVEKILDSEMRPIVPNDSDSLEMSSGQSPVKHYLVKWKGLSYLHCTWVSEKEFHKAYKECPRLKMKVVNFHKQESTTNNSEDEFVAIRPEWTTVDRVLACRGDDDEKEYFVKWKELSYDECYWEFESDISSFQKEIDRFHDIKPRRQTKRKSNARDNEKGKKTNDFQPFEDNPEFLSGGSLHPYQLEGLNFLRFSWSKQTHVILADEMGLGKTIQSIAFLASLFEDNIRPHIVVAPLSTLRNWEREFAMWAPQMNVVMYVGSSQARSVIREYEFYFPKSSKKKKKSGQTVVKSKQDRIKFDVLLTSYEMINLDTASLKHIQWECMIVDEGHRLKNKDSKLFSLLKQFLSKHRVLLTGTPLQNNLDELFMLMHFLDTGKFGSLEEFQEEFKDINQEEQILRLHKMLAPHLLRRVKKDVMKELPPKKELILRVDLSSKQKEYYKAILTRNYEILTRKGGAQISLINVVMELRKVCCHPYMLEGVEPDIPDPKESFKQLLESSKKLQLLDKLMLKLKEQGHRVLIYSQFQHMLDLLEDYVIHRKWQYERIDGKVGGAERQIRIDRFNGKNSSRFCFLLSTRAGGLGINLATADTVIIYDSDWNPHADLQAMARAHRLGQTNKVLIYRLITRGSIEERMMQMTQKKMVLEHLVVGKLKSQNINQEQLNDIIRYGSKELFADEDDETGKSRQIHYDDDAIDRLLNREQVGDEDSIDDEEEEDGFLKAFKVANYNYVDEEEKGKEDEQPVQPAEDISAINNPEKASYWEELLKDRYEVHKVDELNAMGKGKRSRKQMLHIEDNDCAGLEDVSSDGEDDDNYEAEVEADAELSEGETSVPAIPVGKKASRKRVRVDLIPLMEGEGRSLRIMGFNRNQRAAFVQILMRFGLGEYDWAEFTSRLKQKTYEEINEYANLFLAHISENITDAPTFSDGVPKEGLRIEDLLVRISLLSMMRDKLKFASENPGSPLFEDEILLCCPGIKSGRSWKEEYDILLLRAELRHGYGRWQAIVDDKDLKIQELICQELNLPSMTAPVFGAPLVNEATSSTEFPAASNGAQGPQDIASLSQYRDLQRKLVEFVKKRLLLLEKALTLEYQKEVYGYGSPAEAENADVFVAESNIELPEMQPLSAAETSAATVNKPDHLELARLYNEMCKVVGKSKQSGGFQSSENNSSLENISQEINRILTPSAPSNSTVPPGKPAT
ncbi:CHD3-type chromatin-remodeling factor PICKLE-like [Impatiens glandulifera]|uniref:CHD3-type chromatin-remodeling factor PICKLE-like n=1 Tax=Impatiens glandulifera TaxID=253017 RepID=UPI001FB05AD3|nr:CHD3-type chromatin-remodeling factor PICKLE-like [Impatiens glandulifera]